MYLHSKLSLLKKFQPLLLQVVNAPHEGLRKTGEASLLEHCRDILQTVIRTVRQNASFAKKEIRLTRSFE